MSARRFSTTLLLTAGLMFAPVARAAVDAFIWFDTIRGESTDAKHLGWIEVSSLQLDQIRQAATTIGSATGGAGAGKVSFHDISFTKRTDKASPALFKGATSGQHYPQAKLSVRKAGGGQQEFLVLKLQEVFITSYRAGGTRGGGASPTESFTLNFASAAFEGQAQATPTPKPNPAGAVAAPVGSVKR